MTVWRQTEFTVSTDGRGLYEITAQLTDSVADSGIQTGLCHCFVQHTSASLLITENADPDVLTDLEDYFSRQVPDGDPRFRHSAEGPDDMPAHIRSIWTGSSHSIPVRAAQPALGTWQGLYLWEHRSRPHRRRVVLTISGQ